LPRQTWKEIAVSSPKFITDGEWDVIINDVLRPRSRTTAEFEVVAGPPRGLNKTVRVTHYKTGATRVYESDYPFNSWDKQFVADLDRGVF
jgi:hypothetical protein